MVLGKGPLRAIMRSREGIWQSLFENWERYIDLHTRYRIE